MSRSKRKKKRLTEKPPEQAAEPDVGIAADRTRPLTVQLSEPKGLARLKPVFDLLSVLGLFLSILVLGISTHLSWLQFRYAQRQSCAADEALSKASRAQQLSEDAERQIATYTNLLVQLRDELARTKDMAELSDLTLRAESGDRQALITLNNKSRDNNWILTTIAEKNLNRVLARFTGMEISDPGVAARINGLHFMENKDAVERFLNSPQYETRVDAVDTVRFLRVNALIPKVIDIALSDPDLHVVQVACNTLNKLLLEPDAERQLQETGGSVMQPLSIYDFVVVAERTKTELLAKWEQRKDRLLAVKPKYWKQAEGNKQVLVDPEQK